MVSSELVLSSPAKINLYLDVLRRRPDGYHDLVTVFERISLCDRITLTRRDDERITVRCAHPAVPSDERNLAYKAAVLLKEETGFQGGVAVTIDKKIPVGGGLGGGSSNAATVLTGLNRLFDLRLSPSALIRLANLLGSDVAFFMLDSPFALGRGRGGNLAAIDPKRHKPLWHVLLIPPLAVNTKQVYQNLRFDLPLRRGKRGALSLTNKKADVKILTTCLIQGRFAGLAGMFFNRLEEGVFGRYSLLSRLRDDAMAAGFSNVRMSGSGSTLYSVYASQSQARAMSVEVGRRLKGRCEVLLARTLFTVPEKF